MSHFSAETKFKFSLFDIPILEQFSNPQSDFFEKEAIKIRKKWTGKRILGSIGRLIKIDSDMYLEALSKILNNNPNTIYLACGKGDMQNIREKLIRYNIDEERFIFTGFVNPHLYGYVIDYYLDTFPLHSGEALNEYIAKGRVPLILLNKNHIAKDTYIRLGMLDSLEKIHAFSVEEYVKIANYILSDDTIFEKVKKNMILFAKQVSEKLLEIKKTVDDFVNIVEEANHA